MKELSRHAAAAKAIRTHLKAQGITARVTASRYSGGSSVRVALTNELPATVATVKEFAEQYQAGQFDGMTDSYDYSNRRDDIPQVSYVFVENDFTDELKAEAWAWLRATYAVFADAPEAYDPETSYDGEWGSTWIHQVLNGTRGEFHNDRLEADLARREVEEW